MRRLLLALCFGLLACTGASGYVYLGGSAPGSGPAPPPPPPPGTTQPLGINTVSISYGDPQQPFLNIMKAGGASNGISGYTGWYTSYGSTRDSGEEAYLQLDSDGYATSLAASPTPPGGQKFAFLQTLLDYNLPGATGGIGPFPLGASSVYPAGQYRLKYIGLGTVSTVAQGDGGIQSGDTCTSGGLTNAASQTYVSCTFHAATPGANHGIVLEITAINSNTDYPRDISVVLESQAANYDAGAIFNPLFLQAMGGFSSIRFMQWENLDGEFYGPAGPNGGEGYTVSGTLAAGATTAALSSGVWNFPSGAYPVIFIDGEQRSGNFTLGSAAFNWSGALTNTITSTTWGNANTGVNFWVDRNTWAARSLPSNAFWDRDRGVPYEVLVALANKLNANPWINTPFLYSDSDVKAMGQLIMSGTGMQSGYAALSSTLQWDEELSNELWNEGEYAQGLVSGSLASLLWPGATPGGGNAQWNYNYNGYRSAQVASDLQAATGAAFSRVVPILGAQAANDYTASQALQTPDWAAGPASNYPIKGVAIAPYWGNNLSAADCTTMTGVSTPLDDFFQALLFSATGTAANGSHTYSSVGASGGWLSAAEQSITNYVNFMAAYPSLSLTGYEGGQNFFSQANQCAGWTALILSAERDPRMGTAHTNYFNFWKTYVGGTEANINEIFADVSTCDQYGCWGLLESPMQQLSPLSSAPYKWQAAQNYIQ